MAQIQRIKTGDTNWGDEATKLNTNFNQLNQNKVEAVPGSRLITEEEAQKLNDLQNLEQPNLNETNQDSFAYVKGQEKIQLIMKAQELQNPPTSSTLTYQVNGETFSYKIGQFVRAIVDGEPKIYQLYNIVNGSAVWKETNTGSGGGGEVSGYAEGFSWYELTNPGDIKPVNGITLSKSLVTYTIAESGITGDTTNIYSLIVWDPTDATDKTVTYKASAGLTVEINEGVIANITAEPGDYTITITTVDGSHTATLNVKIQPSEPANVPVESISVSKSEVEIDTNNSGGISVVSLNFQSVQGSHNHCVVSILKYPNKTARENSRNDYGDFTSTLQSTWIIKNFTESTVMSITLSGEECLGINQVASNAIWRIDGVAQSGRTGTVDCDNELHNIQFNGG